MNSYKIQVKYKAADKIIEFSKKIKEDKGNIKGKDLEGRMGETELAFRTDDMTYTFIKRIEGQNFSIYSGKAYVEEILLGEALAKLEKTKI